MHRTTRIVASTLAIAALGVAGTQTGANATPVTNTCVHGAVAPSSGHANGVEYIGFVNVAAGHIHRYKHLSPNPHYGVNIC